MKAHAPQMGDPSGVIKADTSPSPGPCGIPTVKDDDADVSCKANQSVLDRWKGRQWEWSMDGWNVDDPSSNYRRRSKTRQSSTIKEKEKDHGQVPMLGTWRSWRPPARFYARYIHARIKVRGRKGGLLDRKVTFKLISNRTQVYQQLFFPHSKQVAIFPKIGFNFS